MNLPPVTTTTSSNTLTPNASVPVASATGAASNPLSSMTASSNPLAQLAALGNAPTQGVQATQNFQSTLAAALSTILSGLGSSSSSEDGENNLVPDFGSTLMPLRLQLAIGALNRSALAAQSPSHSSGGEGTQASSGGAAPA